MKTVGIIAEYNPFHNGHLYQLKKAKELAGADYAIIVMSGNFTQRGTPALLDKYSRTKMALGSSADLVIELPVCFATGSAEYFAKGAVSVLHGLGVDAICFGSECGDVSSLRALAQILHDEPEVYKKHLEKNLQTGMSFPAARSLALTSYLSECNSTDMLPVSGLAADTFSTILQEPNNILGIEYLKALIALNASMEVYTVPRIGSGYLDTSLPATPLASAMAIRQTLKKDTSTEALSAYLPQASLDILKRESKAGNLTFEDDFSSVLFYKLLSLQKEGYTAYQDVSPALSDKIVSHLELYLSWMQFCDILKSKDITYTRISRCLLHILLDIRKEDLTTYSASGYALYARILGFRKEAQPLFGHLKKDNIPLISKLADANNTLSDTAKKQLAQDIYSAHVYDSILAQKTGRPIQNEYRRQIVIV